MHEFLEEQLEHIKRSKSQHDCDEMDEQFNAIDNSSPAINDERGNSFVEYALIQRKEQEESKKNSKVEESILSEKVSGKKEEEASVRRNARRAMSASRRPTSRSCPAQRTQSEKRVNSRRKQRMVSEWLTNFAVNDPPLGSQI